MHAMSCKPLGCCRHGHTLWAVFVLLFGLALAFESLGWIDSVKPVLAVAIVFLGASWLWRGYSGHGCNRQCCAPQE